MKNYNLLPPIEIIKITENLISDLVELFSNIQRRRNMKKRIDTLEEICVLLNKRISELEKNMIV